MRKIGTTLCLVLVIAFAALAAPAMAASGTIDVSGMTPAQQQAMRAMAEELTADKTQPAQILDAIKQLNINQETVKGWADAGTEAGKAVTNFTRELAVPVNDFLDSYIGKAMFTIVFMNYGGGKLASFILDVAIFTVLTPFFLVFISRVFRRFVLHQRLDEQAKWKPARSNEDGKEPAFELDRETAISVSTTEAVLGWIFVVGVSTFYLATMWPTWPM